MPAHPDLLTAFGAALRGGPLPPGVTARDPSEAERRFAVYRNNVAVSLTDALAARFPGQSWTTALADDESRLLAAADAARRKLRGCRPFWS